MALIEVLVSLIVAGLFLSALLQGATTAVRRMRLSALQAQAADIARNRIELLSAWPALLPAPPRGRSEGLEWRVQQVGVERSEQEATGAVVLRTFRVVVTATDDATPLIDVTVKRLGRAP